MLWNRDIGFEVEYKGDTYVVDLEKMTYSCRSWDLTGILCPNAISVIHHIDKNPANYVHSFYRKEKYKQTYAHMM